MNYRVQKLRNELAATKPYVDSERCRIFTESMKETDGLPIIIRRAKSFYEVLDQMTAAYDKLVKRIAGLKKDTPVDQAAFDAYRKQFEDCLCNDINTASAITVLYDVLKADISDGTKFALAESFDTVLSLGLTAAQAEEPAQEPADDELTAFVNAKIAERAEAKKAKDFAKADAIRAELLEKGIQIKDTREGVVWEKI
jgi:cysteinyl-tRNA synthetase